MGIERPENGQEGMDQGKLDELLLSWGEALFKRHGEIDADDSGVRNDLMDRVQSDPNLNPATKEEAMRLLSDSFAYRDALRAWKDHLSSLLTPEQRKLDAEKARGKEAERNSVSARIMLESAAKSRRRQSEEGQQTYVTKDGPVKGKLLGPKGGGKWTIQTDKGKIDVERP